MLEWLQGNKLLYLPLRICKIGKAGTALTSTRCICVALLISSLLVPQLYRYVYYSYLIQLLLHGFEMCVGPGKKS